MNNVDLIPLFLEKNESCPKLSELDILGSSEQGQKRQKTLTIQNLQVSNFLGRAFSIYSAESKLFESRRDCRCFTRRKHWGVAAIRCGSRILLRGPSRVLTPRGGAWAQNLLKIGVFPLKLPENCMMLKKHWGKGTPLDPLLAIVWNMKHAIDCSPARHFFGIKSAKVVVLQQYVVKSFLWTSQTSVHKHTGVHLERAPARQLQWSPLNSNL